LGLIVLIYLG